MLEKTLPLKRLPRVFHVGTLNALDKGVRGASLEGNGLSVSLHPQEWTRIAGLGGGATFSLRRDVGEFLDFRALSLTQREGLTTWGLAQGWCLKDQCWQLEWRDAETDHVMATLHDSEVVAQAELEGMLETDDSAALSQVAVLRLSAQAQHRLGFKVDPLSSLDMLATFFVEDCTSLDGVWWDDELAPHHLSAPRGVIAASRVHRWNISRS